MMQAPTPGPDSNTGEGSGRSARRAIFYADYNHESDAPIKGLLQRLPSLKEQGYNTIFFEFLFVDPRGAYERLGFDPGAQYLEFSNRIKNQVSYVDLVQKAFNAGFNVWGLSVLAYGPNINKNGSEYRPLAQGKSPLNQVFRRTGPFDVVVAEIVRSYATGPDNYVVFLGSEHWPLLSPMLDLELVTDEDATSTAEGEDETYRQVIAALTKEHGGKAHELQIELAANVIKMNKSKSASNGFDIRTLGQTVTLRALPELCKPDDVLRAWRETPHLSATLDHARAEIIAAKLDRLRGRK
ncbi:MAG TPA: hypothetical protein VFS43_47395 [Polyangiaceae bacterium]|nr:hypothetical protein [Polyangiaceae bacterium]